MTLHRVPLTRTFAAAAAVVAAGGAAAVLATSSGAQTAATPTTIKLVQKDDKFAFVDVAPRGGDRKPPSGGDEFVTSAKLLDPTSKASAGTTEIVCVVTEPGRKAVASCTGTAVLKQGSISLSGASAFAAKESVLAVTGGTGQYAGARGTVTEVNSSSGDTAPVTVSLLP